MVRCPSCDAQIAAGLRWCTICHINVVDPKVGRLASPGKRFAAFFLDIFLPVLAMILIVSAASLAADPSSGKPGESGGAAVGVMGVLLFMAYGVWALVLFFKGSTPGKIILGMYVVREGGKKAGFFIMLIRELVGKTLSGMIFSLGFFWILFDREYQGWHDKLMSTYVVQRTSDQLRITST